MGNHHFADKPPTRSFQKGPKPLPFEVESASEVTDDGVVGVPLLEEGDLPLEVLPLRPFP